MGLIIEKQRTKEEDGNVVTKRGIRERVTRPQVKKYTTERKEREKIGKGENKERNIKSEEKKYSEKTPSGSKTKDTTNKRTKGKTAITNAEGSGETTRREEKEEEEFKSNWIPEHEDLVTFVLVSGSHTPDEGHDDDDESTSSSSFSFFASSSSTSSVLGRFQEKKPVPRFPSSRPTSLETIIEDGPCPYSFQEAIMSSSLDSRAFYRDCRGSLESLLGRNRGTHRNLPRKTDGFGGDIVLGRKKILSDILAEEENSGEDFLSVPEEEEEDGEEEWRDFLEKTMEGVVDAAAVGRKGESIDGSFSFPGEFLLEGEELKSLMNDSPLPYSFTAQDEAGDGPLTQDCQPDEDVVDAVSGADEGLPEGAAETDDACEEKHSKGIPEEADDFVDYDPRDIIHPSKDSDDGVNEDHHHHHNYSDGVLRERPTAEGDTAEVLDTIGDKRCIPDNECSDVERRQHLHQHHLLDPDGTQITTSDRDRCPGEVDGQREGGGGLEVIADGDEGAADEGDEGATDEGDEGAADEVVLDEGGTNGCRDILKKEGVDVSRIEGGDVSRKEEGDVSRSEGADMSKEGEGGTDVTKKEEVSPKEVSFSVYIQLEALNEEVTIEEKRGEGKEEEGKEATTEDGDEGEKKEQNKATEERIMSEAITKEMDGTITITNDITLETTTNKRSEQKTNKQNERILEDRDKVKTEEWDVEMTDKPKEGTTKEREEARQEGGEGRLAPKYLREFVKGELSCPGSRLTRQENTGKVNFYLLIVNVNA
ncbi:uncharacterized protein LOC121858517 [Homarus americanus]|uniref:uncharacterized protein LOC121858517 n=1 Tax=Homarus americanus TaxID=6706 RepID=UPI001C445913|nr:uncharacterized protein LOC121858517 [Homarus americanus]